MARLLLLSLLTLNARAEAQEFFLRTYGTREGLVHDRVNGVVEDPRGYLWIATWEGLARFDGRNFESYGVQHGLPVALVFSMAVDPEGRLWVAPHGRGVARLASDALGAPRFLPFQVGADEPANSVDAILLDERGIWVGTARGVFRAREREEPRFELVWDAGHETWDLQAGFRHAGRGWIVTATQALELTESGVKVHPGPPGEPPRDNVNAWPTPEGRVLIATRESLFVFDAQAAAAGEEPWGRAPFELPAGEIVHATALDARGRACVGTVRGLLLADGSRVRRLTMAEGLPDDWLRSLSLDRAGTLWIGSNLGGLTCLREPTIASFLGREERTRMNVGHVLQAASGELLATANDRGILRLEEEGLANLPGSLDEPFVNVHVRMLQDRSGDWWLGTASGAWRVRGPELELGRAEPVPIEGGGGVLSTFFEDQDGRILMGGSDYRLHALDPRAAQPRFVHELSADALGGSFPRAFQRDRERRLWLATNQALWRLDGGVLVRIEPGGELSAEQCEPRALLLDSRGALWVGTRHAGVAIARDPAATEPHFERLSLENGLPSNYVPALAEDEAGRVWIATGKGLARFDPGSGELRLFSTFDGLAGETVNALLRAADGTLWAGCAGGLARLDPSRDPPASLPPVCLIRRFEAGGRLHPVPEEGVTRLKGIELAPSRRDLAVAFVGIDLANGDTLRFQHRLVGLDEDWSAPENEASVRYGSLAPGDYQLLVRALTHDGIPSAAPAVVEFRLLAPLWQRPWFLGLALALLVGLVATLVAARRQRTRALARIRTQIAADLHDEVGSNLAQIAVLSEVARGEGDPDEKLREVAELARETRGSMADLVWAIDPNRDTLADLVQRLRSVTANLLDGGQELVLRVPTEEEASALELAPDRRRHLLFFLKEALHNVQRHAHASRVEVELTVKPGRLRVHVRDDGCGFDPRAPSSGHGLANLRQRARELQAELSLDTSPGRGTKIELDVEL